MKNLVLSILFLALLAIQTLAQSPNFDTKGEEELNKRTAHLVTSDSHQISFAGSSRLITQTSEATVIFIREKIALGIRRTPYETTTINKMSAQTFFVDKQTNIELLWYGDANNITTIKLADYPLQPNTEVFGKTGKGKMSHGAVIQSGADMLVTDMADLDDNSALSSPVLTSDGKLAGINNKLVNVSISTSKGVKKIAGMAAIPVPTIKKAIDRFCNKSVCRICKKHIALLDEDQAIVGDLEKIGAFLHEDCVSNSPAPEAKQFTQSKRKSWPKIFKPWKWFRS